MNVVGTYVAESSRNVRCEERRSVRRVARTGVDCSHRALSVERSRSAMNHTIRCKQLFPLSKVKSVSTSFLVDYPLLFAYQQGIAQPTQICGCVCYILWKFKSENRPVLLPIRFYAPCVSSRLTSRRARASRPSTKDLPVRLQQIKKLKKNNFLY